MADFVREAIVEKVMAPGAVAVRPDASPDEAAQPTRVSGRVTTAGRVTG
ncbi:hypothetical protein [Streptomyces glomeratus]|uniref:Uncharacterized protein n=1 Tax=Streptomyces glomeratus TaxID=284452 RepID=A0ABN3YDR0_9ACTN|nr:hypothetical protein [Streptomyces glomeratus]MCF1509039.1 hypothetical protein [Streptomyces glomeratus]